MTTLTLEKPVKAPPKPEAHISRAWTGWEKFLFRAAFIFFLLLVIPVDYTWYVKLFSVKTG
jgi:hypothetical protein